MNKIINHRTPTPEDGDYNYEVCFNPGGNNWIVHHWSVVREGQSWFHTPGWYKKQKENEGNLNSNYIFLCSELADELSYIITRIQEGHIHNFNMHESLKLIDEAHDTINKYVEN